MTQHRYLIEEQDVEFTAIRAQGSGGQNVNKVSSAVHLRFDIRASSLPEPVCERLLSLRDRRITATGVIVIKAQSNRSQTQNRLEALARLQELIDRPVLPSQYDAARGPQKDPDAAASRPRPSAAPPSSCASKSRNTDRPEKMTSSIQAKAGQSSLAKVR